MNYYASLICYIDKHKHTMNRLPRSVLEVSKRMLTEPSRNPVAAIVEKEAGWLLLSSLLSSLTKEVKSCLHIVICQSMIYNRISGVDFFLMKEEIYQ